MSGKPSMTTGESRGKYGGALNPTKWFDNANLKRPRICLSDLRTLRLSLLKNKSDLLPINSIPGLQL